MLRRNLIQCSIARVVHVHVHVASASVIPAQRHLSCDQRQQHMYKSGTGTGTGTGTRSSPPSGSGQETTRAGQQESTRRRQPNRTSKNQRQSPHVTNKWEEVTRDLLQLTAWDPSHKRKAQQCLQHWSRNRLSHRTKDMLPGLWSRVQRWVPQQETSAAMYDFTVLALAKNGFADQALQVFHKFIATNFNHLPQNNRHIPSSYHLNAVVSSLSRNKQPQAAQDLLMTMYSDGPVEPNVYSVTSVLDGWSRLGQGKQAQALLDQCIQRGLEPSIVCYNAVMAAWSRSNAPDAPTKAHTLLKSISVSPDAFTWSSYLKACRDPSTMESNLWTAYRSGQPLNSVSFNVVLNAWGKAGNVERAQAFVTSWVQLVADNQDVPRDLWPRLDTFNTLLNALARSGNSEQALHWLKQMKSMGVDPDDISYNCLIDAMAKQGKAQEAQNVWERVTMRDRKNEYYACNTVLSAWANYARKVDGNKKNTLERAQAFFDAMVDRGLTPTVITYNALLKVISACNEPEETEDLLRKMKEGAAKPDIISYAVVIDAFAKASKPQIAHDIHRFMTVPPNVASFNSVIHAYSKWDEQSAADQVELILLEMNDAGVEPDLMTYCSLLTVWSRSKNVDKAKRARLILNEMNAKYEDLAPQHRNAEELLRNAQTMVLACCAHLPMGSHDLEASKIAVETFGEIQAPTFVTYATYLQALHRLEKDPTRRDAIISEVFLRYCSESNEINSLVLHRLKHAASPAMFETLLAKAEALKSGKENEE